MYIRDRDAAESASRTNCGRIMIDWKEVWLENIRGNVSGRLDFKVMLGDTIPALTEIVVKSLSA